MTALFLEISESLLDSVNRFRAGLAPILPPPRCRKFNAGNSTKLSEAQVRKMVQTFHNSPIEKRSVMRISEKGTDSFHLLFSIACTQYLWLTYWQLCIYGNCVDAICQRRK